MTAEPHRQREELLQELARRIGALTADRFLRIAVDGPDGAGKTTFARDLAARLAPGPRPCVLASADDFMQDRARRYRQGRSSPQGFFEDTYDYPLLRACLLDPLGPAGDGRYRLRGFDYRQDLPVACSPCQAQPRTILLLEGLFLHRDSLRDLWDFSLFLQADPVATYRRMSLRDGCPADPAAPANHRYYAGQQLYLAQHPQRHATVVIDADDLDRPTLSAPTPAQPCAGLRPAGEAASAVAGH